MNTTEVRCELAAQEMFKDSKLSLRRAAKIHGISKDKLARYRKVGPAKPSGRPPALGFDLEGGMASFLTECAKIGWPMTLPNMRKMAFDLAQVALPVQPFSAKGASSKWLSGMLKINIS